jgi:hypothetical protein
MPPAARASGGSNPRCPHHRIRISGHDSAACTCATHPVCLPRDNRFGRIAVSKEPLYPQRRCKKVRVTCLVVHPPPEPGAAARVAPASVAARYRQAGRAARASPATPPRLGHRVCVDPGSWQGRIKSYESPRAKFAGRHYLAQIKGGGLRKKWLPAISCNNAAPDELWLPAEQAHETLLGLDVTGAMAQSRAARRQSTGSADKSGRQLSTHRADTAALTRRSAFDFLCGFPSRLDGDRLRVGRSLGGLRRFLGQPQCL